MIRKITTPWLKAPDSNTVIKSTIRDIIGRNETDGIDNLVKYFKTLYNGERNYPRVVETKENMSQQDIKEAKTQTDLHIYLEDHLDDLSKICDYRLREHYGSEYDDKFISVPDNYLVADIPEGFPTSKRHTTTAYPITDQEMKNRYLKSPLIPVKREDNVIKLMGLDSKTNRPVLFALSVEQDKATYSQNILLVLEAHGEEEGIININRVTCNPTTIHKDFERDEFGKIVLDRFGVAKTIELSPVYTSNHNFCMQDRLKDPNGYSARVDVLDEGLVVVDVLDENLVVKGKKALRKEVTLDGQEELYPATFDDALSIFMNKHNILYCQTPRYIKGKTQGACPDIDTLLGMHFDDMIIVGENTPFTLKSYKELAGFALGIASEQIQQLQNSGQNIDMDNPANKIVLSQKQKTTKSATVDSLLQDTGLTQ